MQSLDQQYLRKQKQCIKAWELTTPLLVPTFLLLWMITLPLLVTLSANLKTANLIVTVKGYRKGQYYSTESHK